MTDEGIPPPEGTGSGWVLKVKVPACQTVYVRVPIKASYFKPFSAYITVYSKDYDIYVSPYVVLGGVLAQNIGKLPKMLRLTANTWGRFITYWFMEVHHECSEVVIEIYNPQTVDVYAYIGMISAGEIMPDINGYCVVFGWEDTFELELNNELITYYAYVMVLLNIVDVVHVSV